MNQVLLIEQHSRRLQVSPEARVGLLRHHHQDIGLRDVRVKDGLVGDDQLRATGAAARFRAEALGQSREFAVVDGCGFANHHARQDNALSAESRDADFRGRHQFPPPPA